MIVQIISLVLVVYLLTGFLPGRALRGKKGRWYYIGAFNKILGVANGSTTFPIVPLPWPFRVIRIELTWTEYQKVNETYQGDIQRYMNVEKGIGTKIELTNLRHLEEHPIVIDVILKDGYEAALVFDVTLTVFDPLKLVPRKGFLTYVQQEFSDVVSPWAHDNKDIETILLVKIEEIEKDTTFELGENENGVLYNLRTFLDEKKFKPYGFCIKELSLKAGLPKNSQEYFNIKNREKQEGARLAELKAVELRRVQERETFTNDATTEREVQEKDLKVTKDYQVDIIEKIYTGKKEVAAAYTSEVLVINSGDSSKDEVQSTKVLTDSLTAGLITHKRLSKVITVDSSTVESEEKKKGKS